MRSPGFTGLFLASTLQRAFPARTTGYNFSSFPLLFITTYGFPETIPITDLLYFVLDLESTELPFSFTIRRSPGETNSASSTSKSSATPPGNSFPLPSPFIKILPSNSELPDTRRAFPFPESLMLLSNLFRIEPEPSAISEYSCSLEKIPPAPNLEAPATPAPVPSLPEDCPLTPTCEL